MNPSRPEPAAYLQAVELSRVFRVRQPAARGWSSHWRPRAMADVTAVNSVDLSVQKGEVLAIVGESGSGKTTLANMIARVTEPSSGQLLLGGRDIAHLQGRDLRALRRDIQIIFQDPASSLNPRQTVGDIIALPLALHGIGAPAAHRERVAELLRMVHLPVDAADRYPGSLSGGQKQRVNIARALALEPKVLVLDEPTSALDVSVQARILALLMDLKQQRQLTYVVITHDLGVVRSIADRVAVMYLGRIVESGPVSQIMEAPAHPYTRALMSAIPLVHEKERALLPKTQTLTGELPSLVNAPTHCAFYSRCSEREPDCSRSPVPSLRTLRPAHEVRCLLAVEAQVDMAG